MCEQTVEVGSLWRRKPPGRETVRVERVWLYGEEDPALTVRAHPINGGRPLVAPVTYLLAHYTAATPPEPRPAHADDPDGGAAWTTALYDPRRYEDEGEGAES